MPVVRLGRRSQRSVETLALHVGSADARGVTGGVISVTTVGGEAGRAAWSADARNATGSTGQAATVGGVAGRSGSTADARGPTGSTGPVEAVGGLAGRVSWEADARGATGSLGTPVLTLDDFDTAGLDVPVLMLIEAGGSEENLYQEGSIGSLLDGSDADLSDDIRINRIRWYPDNNQFRLNRSGTGGFSAHFGGETGDLSADLSLTLIFYDTQQREIELDVTDHLVSVGGGFVNFAIQTQVERNQVSNIGNGDRFILALWRTSLIPAVGGDAGRATWNADARDATGIDWASSVS